MKYFNCKYTIYNESHYTVYERHHLIFGKTNELTE